MIPRLKSSNPQTPNNEYSFFSVCCSASRRFFSYVVSRATTLSRSFSTTSTTSPNQHILLPRLFLFPREVSSNTGNSIETLLLTIVFNLKCYYL